MASSGGVGAFKDVALALVIVGGVLGGLFLYTGVWPPMVVVESGSMMHLKSEVGYGKLGTIDPGDMVFVKKAEKRGDVTTMAEGLAKNADDKNYGKPGDVLIYFPYNNRARTPIIHRAIGYVTAESVDAGCQLTGNPGNAVTYSVFWEGAEHTFGSSGIYLPTMGFGAPNYSEDRGYKPCWSGFITKGDNPVSNRFPDQAFGGGTLPKDPVQLAWVEGKAVGELPWFGLIKLALSGTVNYQCQVAQANDPACDADARGQTSAVRVLNANAPADLWVMLGLSLAIIAIAPLGYDMYIIRRQKEGGDAGSQPGEKREERPSLVERLMAALGLGRRASPKEPEGADPKRAFEAPPVPSAPSPPPPPPGAGGAAKPGPGGTTRFQRVDKK
jgi:signal peptidase